MSCAHRSVQPLDGDDVDAEVAQGRDLGRVVRQQDDLLGAEVVEDRGAGGVLAGVDGQAQRGLRVDGVGAAVLLGVGPQLVDEPDAAALVAAEVDHDPALAADAGQRRLQLGSAVAAQRPEGVAGEALASAAGPAVGAPAAGCLQPARADERDVLVAGQRVAVAVGGEGAVDASGCVVVASRSTRSMLLAPGDELLDGDDGQSGLTRRGRRRRRSASSGRRRGPARR